MADSARRHLQVEARLAIRWSSAWGPVSFALALALGACRGPVEPNNACVLDCSEIQDDADSDAPAPTDSLSPILDVPSPAADASTASVDSQDDFGASGSVDVASSVDVAAEPVDAGLETDIISANFTWPVHVFAPYVDATLYPFQKLTDVAKSTGQRWFTLAFIVDKTGSGCEASWGTYYTLAAGPDAWVGGQQLLMYDDLALLRQLYQGDVAVSFGGASGTPLEVACKDVGSLKTQLAKVVQTLQVQRIDFDIEGIWLTETKPGQSGERRAQAIASLQDDLKKAGTPLQVWLTLPVLPSGLAADGLATLAQTLENGAELGGINVMTMDYGDGAAPAPAGKMGKYAIDAATALQAQLGSAYQKIGKSKSQAELWAMVGATPMVGLNDVATETFHIADASELLVFAQQKGLGLLAMWSVNRDHPCNQATVQLNCSSITDQGVDWQFTSTFSALNGK